MINYGFKESVVQFIAREILIALAYLHQKGIIHRNVCASNVLVTEEGWIKLSNFSQAIFKHPLCAEPFYPGWFSFDCGYYDAAVEDVDCDILSLGIMTLSKYLYWKYFYFSHSNLSYYSRSLHWR